MALFESFNKKSRKNEEEMTPEELEEKRKLEEKKSLEKKEKTILNKFAKYTRVAAISIAILAAPFAKKGGIDLKNESKRGEYEDPKNKTENVIETDKNVNLSVKHRIKKADESGKKTFNAWSLLAPIDVEYKRNKEIKETIEKTIPYEWAEKFVEINAKNPEDRTKTEQAFLDRKSQEFLEIIDFYGIGKTTQKVDAARHGYTREEGKTYKNIQVKSIEILGTTSPEGRTAESILPGNLEEENKELGLDRARDVLEIFMTNLSGEDNPEITIAEKEVQFSKADFTSLIELAEKNDFLENGEESITAIFNFIKAYNRGEIQDAESINKMKEIIDSKRTVSIKIELEGQESKDVIIPIPLLLLLLPSLTRVKKMMNFEKAKNQKETTGGKDDDEEKEEIVHIKIDPEEEIVEEKEEIVYVKIKSEEEKEREKEELELIKEKPRQIFSETVLDKERLDKEDKNYHELYAEAENIEKISYEDLRKLSKMVFMEELYEHINNKDSIENGLDYKKIIDFARDLKKSKSPAYNTDSEIKEKTAEVILEAWQKYDRNIREGVKTVEGEMLPEDTTLEYKHDTKKILWAKEAATHIMKLIKAENDEELSYKLDEIYSSYEDIELEEALERSKIYIKEEREEREIKEEQEIEEVVENKENQLEEIDFQKRKTEILKRLEILDKEEIESYERIEKLKKERLEIMARIEKVEEDRNALLLLKAKKEEEKLQKENEENKLRIKVEKKEEEKTAESFINIHEYLNNKEAEKKGLNYRKILESVKEAEREKIIYSTESYSLRERVADQILISWQLYEYNLKHDTNFTKVEDLPNYEDIKYEKYSPKMLLAREAADTLFELSQLESDKEIELKLSELIAEEARENSKEESKEDKEGVVEDLELEDLNSYLEKLYNELNNLESEIEKEKVKVSKNLELKRENIQELIDNIDFILRDLENKLEDSVKGRVYRSKEERIELEADFNLLEQEKRALQKRLETF